MSFPSDEIIKKFLNALQLAINSRVNGSFASQEKNFFLIGFDSFKKKDRSLDYFTKIIPGEWDQKNSSYVVKDPHQIDWEKLTNFLMLSRLNIENVKHLIKSDKAFRDFGEKMGVVGKQDDIPIKTSAEAAKYVFDLVEKKEMTLRALSEKSGLTQAALNNFKKGGDVRLSSLFKIAKCLGFTLVLREE